MVEQILFEAKVLAIFCGRPFLRPAFGFLRQMIIRSSLATCIIHVERSSNHICTTKFPGPLH